MKKYIHITCFSFLLFIPGVLWGQLESIKETQECPLYMRPSVYTVYESNLDALLDGLLDATDASGCREADGAWKKVKSYVPVNNTLQLLRYIQSTSRDTQETWTESLIYLHELGATPDYIVEDVRYMWSIKEKINKTIQIIGLRCGDTVKIKTNISLPSSNYQTENKLVSTVLKDVYRNQSQLQVFFNRINADASLSVNDFQDEDFALLPEGSLKNLEAHYSESRKNYCESQDPTWRLIVEKMQAIGRLDFGLSDALQSWKNAWRLIKHATVQDGLTEDKKDKILDAQIKAIIRTENWSSGLSGSSIVINADVIQEFWSEAGRNTFDQTVRSMLKWLAFDEIGRAMSETFGLELEFSKKKEQIISTQKLTTHKFTREKTQEISAQIRKSYSVLDSLIKEQAYDQKVNIAPLVQITNMLEGMRKLGEYNSRIACDKILSRQAINVRTPNCRDFLGR